jgi:hypothetical protein
VYDVEIVVVENQQLLVDLKAAADTQNIREICFTRKGVDDGLELSHTDLQGFNSVQMVLNKAVMLANVQGSRVFFFDKETKKAVQTGTKNIQFSLNGLRRCSFHSLLLAVENAKHFAGTNAIY